ncbi:glycosyl hydrolase family 65 protein [Coraliomargarita algicola]|uniref:Glycosyl hydrolase family 65 protein n=1 Tax=Coraliomargarita algicola TaxID=3092156 RepID=A0ABZ0RIR9_9BACT|nr:glycosyl hydrolase family 65 protein [Coraliomargarita sp. J2-16]WPJ94900.1 glycosyl hydrolase family 65 protein [Coraliomargarita sp. J2-16]
MKILNQADWVFTVNQLNQEDVALVGNQCMLGNGYMGYRGTLEEYRSEQLVACMLNGVYDQLPGKWREPVNAPNALFARVLHAGEVAQHRQDLNLRRGRLARWSTRSMPNGVVQIKSERFVSQSNVHLICMRYAVCPSQSGQLLIETGIDADVWDINGPHLDALQIYESDGVLCTTSRTQELGITVAVCETIDCDYEQSVEGSMRYITIDAEANKWYSFDKYVSIYTSCDSETPAEDAYRHCLQARQDGYELLGREHDQHWEVIWNDCDVEIDGDDAAQFALRYSLYHLQLAAPRHSSKVSIPARALSGQVYKGAVFWDTEMFMTPVFTLTNPAVARNLILYRYHSLPGALAKAKEYGYRGAFYAWEGQEEGKEACTHFNVTDVFTQRPMRTYFRDKQIHVSADIVYAIWQYVQITGDFTVLADGAAEVMVECTRFFYSYAYYKEDKDRYELVDVTGPDEYHERVANNAYTNRMVKFCVEASMQGLAKLKILDICAYERLQERLQFECELEAWARFAAKLYVPTPDATSEVIPQFDAYESLEDVSLDALKQRVLDPNEYWGGGNGLATTTKILKQADVLLMLHLFKQEYTREVLRKNWEYYEPRTEHGSSLSACAYAMVAAEIGKADWAYDYFMKTATVDLTGKSKLYVGTLYIGGTHPAANGGAWLSAVYGFAGLRVEGDRITCKSQLPSKWKSLRFHVQWQGARYELKVTHDDVEIKECKEPIIL